MSGRGRGKKGSNGKRGGHKTSGRGKSQVAKKPINEIARTAIDNFFDALAGCHIEFAGIISSFREEVLKTLGGDELTVWLKNVHKNIKNSGIVDGAGNVTFIHAKSVVKPGLTTFKRMFPKSGLDMWTVWEISPEGVRETICAHLNGIYKTTMPAGTYSDEVMEDVKNSIFGDLAKTDPTKFQKFSSLIDDVGGGLGKNPGPRDLREVIGTVTDKIESGELDIAGLLDLAKTVSSTVKREGGGNVTVPIPGFEGVNLDTIIDKYEGNPEELMKECDDKDYKKLLAGMENIGLD